MLYLVVPFTGSWTNSFSNEDRSPLFTSGKTFGDGLRKLEAVPLAISGNNSSRVDAVRALNAANPSMTYRVPASYDNTVRGVLSRLTGEVQRLSSLEAGHPLMELFEALTYSLELTSEHDEVVALATPKNAIQSGGAGVMQSGNPLYSGSSLAARLFGHLGASIEQLISADAPDELWTPKTPAELIVRLAHLKAEQDALVKRLKPQDPDAAYESPFKPVGESIVRRLAEVAPDIELSLDFDAWNWAGALTVLQVYLLPSAEREALAGTVLSARGNLSGFAMSGKLGNITEKDVYAGAGCEKAYSTRMPYSADLWFNGAGDKKRMFSLGVIKKSGVLTLQLDLPDERAQQLLDHIRAAAVGPFHFGKKGIAYLERAYIGN